MKQELAKNNRDNRKLCNAAEFHGFLMDSPGRKSKNGREALPGANALHG